MRPVLEDMNGENLVLLEEYQRQYSHAPTSLDSSWRDFFEGKLPKEVLLPAKTEEEVFRVFGHQEAKIYPEGIKEITRCEELPLGNERLRKIYCSSIGYEFVPFCEKEIQ